MQSITPTKSTMANHSLMAVENPEEAEVLSSDSNRFKSKFSAQEFMILEQNRHLRDLQNQVDSYKRKISGMEVKDEIRKKGLVFYRKLLTFNTNLDPQCERLFCEYERNTDKLLVTKLEMEIETRFFEVIRSEFSDINIKREAKADLLKQISNFFLEIQKSFIQSSDTIKKTLDLIEADFNQEEKKSLNQLNQKQAILHFKDQSLNNPNYSA